MFYRRKILLALLQLFDNEIGKIRLQKLLFLFTQHQIKKEYDFIPYKYGCYSWSAMADLVAMEKTGLLTEIENKTFILNDNKTDYLYQLTAEDINSLKNIKATFGNLDRNKLMKYIYTHYPYWAINSEAKNILTKSELEIVSQNIPKSDKIILYTIGYEGISLEEYFNRLIKNDIKMLIDVRNNPFSMKYGFSKNQLKGYCENLKIQYVHFPEVGIQSKQRKELNTKTDYDKLFAYYKATILSTTQTTQRDIFDLLREHQRIALTCFEADINLCHRKHLADAIAHLPEFCYEIKHI